MSVEYLPVGIACNIKCGYCYQDPMREAGNINVPRNWSKAREQLEKLGQNFAVFGGEPLLAPIEHLEEVWKFGLQKYGSNGIQTNGSLITDEHIELFAKYKVGVGISIDGPGDMNSVRCSDELTLKTEIAIKKLCNLGIIPSIICTIHRGNNDLPRLCNWFNSLSGLGVRHLNLHEMEIDCGRDEFALSEARQIETYLELYKWSETSKLQVLPFLDIKKLLTEFEPSVMCVWNHCDPQTTAAVQGVTPDGVMSNCGRTNKDGVNWVKADSPGLERYVALHQTPQAYGGCRDCRYFAFCKGHCPGTAIDGDWRNRTVNCNLWYNLFEIIENDLLLQGFSVLDESAKESKIAQFLAVHPVNGEHGDTPHGDHHGDHTDYGIPATILKEIPEWAKSNV
jgi:uncharacterized protein